MKCPKCNEEIPDESKFCLHCGAKVEPALMKCVHCGFEGLPADAVFCPNCGKNVNTKYDELVNHIRELIHESDFDRISSSIRYIHYNGKKALLHYFKDFGSENKCSLSCGYENGSYTVEEQLGSFDSPSDMLDGKKYKNCHGKGLV